MASTEWPPLLGACFLGGLSIVTSRLVELLSFFLP